jgi:glutamyl-Q tRNA(Asp) synthetase
MLGFPQPNYTHLPIATSKNNLKLSKQNFASELPAGREPENLWIALKWLKQNPPEDLKLSSAEKIVGWAVENWNPTTIPPKTIQLAPEGFCNTPCK